MVWPGLNVSIRVYVLPGPVRQLVATESVTYENEGVDVIAGGSVNAGVDVNTGVNVNVACGVKLGVVCMAFAVDAAAMVNCAATNGSTVCVAATEPGRLQACVMITMTLRIMNVIGLCFSMVPLFVGDKLSITFIIK